MADAKPSRPQPRRNVRKGASEGAPDVPLRKGQEVVKNDRGQWVIRTQFSKTAHSDSIITSAED